MARATTIWIVTYPGNGALRAAFTVKHELATWLGRRPDEDFAVWRIPDGKYGPDDPPVRLVRSTLEPAWVGGPSGGA